MGMFSWVCKGCGRELIEGELVRLGAGAHNLGVGEYDGYGRAGAYESEYGHTFAWHQRCYDEATEAERADTTPSPSAPDQGFGSRHLEFCPNYVPGAKTTYSIVLDVTEGEGEEKQYCYYFWTAEGLLCQHDYDKRRRELEDKLYEEDGWEEDAHAQLLRLLGREPQRTAIEFGTFEEALEVAQRLIASRDEYTVKVFGTQEKATGLVWERRRYEKVDYEQIHTGDNTCKLKAIHTGEYTEDEYKIGERKPQPSKAERLETNVDTLLLGVEIEKLKELQQRIERFLEEHNA